MINTDVSAVGAVTQDNNDLILLSYSERNNKFASAHCLKTKCLTFCFGSSTTERNIVVKCKITI